MSERLPRQAVSTRAAFSLDIPFYRTRSPSDRTPRSIVWNHLRPPSGRFHLLTPPDISSPNDKVQSDHFAEKLARAKIPSYGKSIFKRPLA
jgi:hypothetical protein